MAGSLAPPRTHTGGQQPSFVAGGSVAAPCLQPGRGIPSPPVAHGSPSHRVQSDAGIDSSRQDRQPLRQPVRHRTIGRKQGNQTVNRIIWIVGLIVIILFIAGFFGLR